MMAAAPPVAGLDELLLAMADDEFVIGFSDSEWTGIAPMLEEDVAMSSLSQDELGHAAALYALLGGVTGQDPDAIAYDREPDAYRHARLLDHGRGDWAMTIARRYLYETADSVRLEALADSSWQPLADLVGKLRREERYHLMHVGAWLERLASNDGEARDRLVTALDTLGPTPGPFSRRWSPKVRWSRLASSRDRWRSSRRTGGPASRTPSSRSASRSHRPLRIRGSGGPSMGKRSAGCGGSSPRYGGVIQRRRGDRHGGVRSRRPRRPRDRA
jgi:hypothetical protein